ncbi:MAG: hypothetical protein K8G79_06675 [bacterium]|uniref:Lipoprotein n=1 Tax=Candidatus Methylomirabilis tolerans TaxID=3123416 RepID=A0AAJ1AHD3_9BACT|nr:hypothetical protein [Candidatus Methylomirabilis sp.]
MLRVTHTQTYLIFLFLTMVAAGCATTGPEIAKPIPLAANDVTWLREQPEIVVIHHQTAQPFRVWMSDAGADFLEGLGAQTVVFALYFSQKAGERLQAKSLREGEQIRTKYSLTDPVVDVKARFVEALRTKLELHNLRPVSESVTDYEPYKLADAFGPVVALDFVTSSWELSVLRSLNPFTSDPYRLSYAVHARLLRLTPAKYQGEPQSPAVARLLHSEDSKIMWQGICRAIGGGAPYITRENLTPLFIPKQLFGEQSYALDEWTAHDAALLKAKLNEVANACAQALLAEFSR